MHDCIIVQAFLEMNTEEAAQTMVTYYSSVTPVIRNHPIFMQYSNHKELKTDNSPNQVVCASKSFYLFIYFTSAGFGKLHSTFLCSRSFENVYIYN